ncbi:MAG TPA: serine/threonine-protein kinase [Drouetiella sp.]
MNSDEVSFDPRDGLDETILESRGGLDKTIHESRGALDKTIHESRSGLEKTVHESRGALDKTIHESRGGLDKTIHESRKNLDKTMLESSNGLSKTILDANASDERTTLNPNRAPLDQGATSVDPEMRNVTEFKPDKLIGTIIADRYELLSLAGRGGMSAVYKARHILTHKVVALKLMLPHLLTDDNAVRRFQQEARAASRLNHPNAISTQDMGLNSDGQPFLTMEYLDGRSLADEIRFNKKIKPKRCLHIFTQVCAALAHAHEEKIIHRDLKPSNVMLIDQDEDSDFVKVVDFGIAKIISDGGADSLKLTTTGDVFGSPLYMSPEQCLGNKLDIRSDVYSMGCLMFESLTGSVPHEGKNVLETMFKHTNLAAPTLSSIDADPRTIYALDQILQKCLAKLPEQRYQTMLALKKDLENVAQADKKGLKIAAQIGMGAADKGRQFDNRLIAFSSKKLFWIGAPLLMVLSVVVLGFAYYWISTSGDPGPNDRNLVLNREVFRSENMARLASNIEKQSKDSSDSVMKESFEKLGLENDNHQLYLDIFSQMLRAKESDVPQSFYYKMMRSGFYFTKNMDYEHAIKAFNLAIETAQRNGFTNQIDNARMHAAMANCMLSMGNAESKDDVAKESSQISALENARLAYKEFADSNQSKDATVTALLGTLLELCSAHPEKFEEGYQYLNNLMSVRQASPTVEGLAYAQAAQFAHAVALNGGGIKIPLIRLDSQYQVPRKQFVDPFEVEQECLQKSIDAWEELLKNHPHLANYNEGVIYNRMGLLAEQQKELSKAEDYFLLAINHLAEANNAKDESAAKVMFNLSDVQLAQHHLLDYYNTHTDAKRVWDGTFHLGKHSNSGV